MSINLLSFFFLRHSLQRFWVFYLKSADPGFSILVTISTK